MDKIIYLEFVKKKFLLLLNKIVVDLELYVFNVKYYFEIKYIFFFR